MDDKLVNTLKEVFLQKRQAIDERAKDLSYSEYIYEVGRALSNTITSIIEDRSLRMAGVKNLGSFINASHRRYLYARSNRCGLCGGLIESIEVATIDHIVPLSIGGQNHILNKQLAHKWCNVKKGNLKISSFSEEASLKHLLMEVNDEAIH